MKILLVNCVYKKGSTGKILNDLKNSYISNGHKCLVAYGRGGRTIEENSYKFCTEVEAKFQAVLTRLGALQYGGNYLSTLRLIRYIKKNRPDVVHLHCINGYCVNIYRLLDFLGTHHFPTVVTHHSEFFYTGSCGHAFDCIQFTLSEGCQSCPQRRTATQCLWRDTSHLGWERMKKVFHSFDVSALVFTSVSPWLKNRALLSPIVEGYENIIVYNGVDTNVFHRYPIEALTFENNFINERGKKVLHVTAAFSDDPTSPKGGRFVIELSKMLPQYEFVVAASLIDVSSTLPSNLIVIGKVDSQINLSNLYSSADLTVITSKRETYSMVCAESLCCGTPVVGFKSGGPESISLSEFSDFADYGNIEQMVEKCKNMLERKYDRTKIANMASLRYGKNKMAEKYLAIYHSLISH